MSRIPRRISAMSGIMAFLIKSWRRVVMTRWVMIRNDSVRRSITILPPPTWDLDLRFLLE
jgi:hypothetical protein